MTSKALYPFPFRKLFLIHTLKAESCLCFYFRQSSVLRVPHLIKLKILHKNKEGLYIPKLFLVFEDFHIPFYIDKICFVSTVSLCVFMYFVHFIYPYVVFVRYPTFRTSSTYCPEIIFIAASISALMYHAIHCSR